jgi:orotate phosphoribosyltransferase
LGKREEIREKALGELKKHHVLMLDGHFDFGNGYHGRVYLNPHQLFCQPSVIWRFAQDLLDLLPAELLEQTDVVAGPVTGGALLAHTVAGLLDSRRALSRPPTLFAPFRPESSGSQSLTSFYARQIEGRRVLLVDDVRNTGQTLARCAELVRAAGGTVVATAQIYDRMEAVADAGVPNVALAEYKAPENHEASSCPLCRDGVPITAF